MSPSFPSSWPIHEIPDTPEGIWTDLLTYAAGLEAVSVVWIAARFTEEHRSTLDWLNKITDERFRFFGLEAELWRIGESLPAPKFNIVARPNDWSRSVSEAAPAIADGELSGTRIRQRAYWSAFHDVLDTLGGPVSGKDDAPTAATICRRFRGPRAHPRGPYYCGRDGVIA